MKVYDIRYVGKVQSQQRPRHRIVKTKDGRVFSQTYEESKSRDFKSVIHLLAQSELSKTGGKPIEGPVDLTLEVFCPIPTSLSKKKRERALLGLDFPIHKPDVDNILKAVMDAVNGVFYTDDRLVVFARVFKQYAEQEGLSLHVEELEAE